MNRRSFITTLPGIIAARHALLAAGVQPGRLGICAFSCNLHWQAARKKEQGVKFSDAPGFYTYCRDLGTDGVQTSVRELDSAAAQALRRRVEHDGAYFEGDVRVPKTEADLADFEREVKLCREAGATVARGILMGARRYEVFKTMAEFRAFHADGRKRLQLAEPILKKHGLKLALENHKDLTADEQVALLKEISSEWIGALVDTGNNLALLEDPYATIDALAPFALSVHLKDMAVQPCVEGFLLSEAPCGTGFLSLPRIAATLMKANPAIVFNLEMATRDPLRIPCLTEGFFATFPERNATHLEAAMQRVKANPLKQPTPSIAGKPLAQQLAEEEANNRVSLQWMHQHLSK